MLTRSKSRARSKSPAAAAASRPTTRRKKRPAPPPALGLPTALAVASTILLASGSWWDSGFHVAVIVVGTSCSLAAAVLPLFGLRASGFDWSPLGGGSRFVSLQTVGWTTQGVLATLSLLAILNLHRGRALLGLWSLLALTSAFGSATLLASAHEFEGTAPKQTKRLRMGFSNRALQIVLPAVGSALSATLYTSLETDVFSSESARTAVLVVALALALASLLAVHSVASFTHGLFWSYSAGGVFSLLSGGGWLILCAVTQIAATQIVREQRGERALAGEFVLCGLAQAIGNSLHMVSTLIFLHDEQDRIAEKRTPKKKKQKKSVALPAPSYWGLLFGRSVWLAAVGFMCFPPLLLALLELAPASWSAGLSSLATSPWARPGLIVAGFLSAPLSHFSGVLKHTGYALWQPLRGGSFFVAGQALGWVLYGLSLILAITAARNGWEVATLPIVPVGVVAQGIISISVLSFKPPPPPPAAARKCKTPKPKQKRKKLALSGGVSLYTVGLVLLCGLAVAHSYAEFFVGSTISVGWGVFVAAVGSALCGFHLLWTHLWLLMSGALLITGSRLAVAAMACLGVNICTGWYASLTFGHRWRIPQRALHGWDVWIFTEGPLSCGAPNWPEEWAKAPAFERWSVCGSMPLGFLLADLGLHLTPAMILLQMSAADIDLVAVLLGYLATRAWSLSVTSHHLTFDWDLWRAARRVRIYRHSHSETLGASMFAPGGVVNDVYGFKPHAPPEFFDQLKNLELAATLAMAAIASLPVPDASAEVFLTLGGGRLATIDDLCVLSPLLTMIGFTILFGGAAVAFLSRVGLRNA